MTGSPRNSNTLSTPGVRSSGSERGVSDLVGYVLMVSVILVGVGLTATIGIDHLEAAQLSQNAQGIERAMELLEGQLDALQTARAERRASSISIGGGQLYVAAGSAPSAITINVSGGGDSPTTYQMGAITYDFDGGEVAYEGGGVFLRTRGGDSIVRAEPTFICTDERAFVSFVRIQGPAAGNGFGGSSARISTVENRSEVLFPKNRSGPGSLQTATGVNVTIHSAHESAWLDYLLDEGQAWETDTDPSTTWDVRCEAPSGGVMPVYVRQTVVNVTVRR